MNFVSSNWILAAALKIFDPGLEVESWLMLFLIGGEYALLIRVHICNDQIT